MAGMMWRERRWRCHGTGNEDIPERIFFYEWLILYKGITEEQFRCLNSFEFHSLVCEYNNWFLERSL